MPLRKFSPKLNLQHMEKVDSPADILHEQIKNKYGDISSKYVEQRKLKTNEKVLLGRGAFKEAFLVIEKTSRKMSVSQMPKLYVAYDFKYPYDESNIKEISNFIKITTKNLNCLKLILCPVDIGIVKKRNEEYIRLIVRYFQGINLETFINKNKCSDNKNDELKLEIMIKLLDALDDLHNKWKYVHHDIKPANIMINIDDTSNPDVSLIDLLGGCFMDEKECAPMSTAVYSLKELDYHDPDDTVNMDINPDIYSIALVFRDMIGLNQFKCSKDLTPFEQKIYNITKDIISGKNNLNQVKHKLIKMKSKSRDRSLSVY